MACPNQSVGDIVSSSLPEVIQNLQSVLDKLRSISDEDSKEQQLSAFISTAMPSVKTFLQAVTNDPIAKRSFSTGAVKPSRAKEKRKINYGAAYQQSKDVSEVKSKKGWSGKSKSRMKKSVSFQSALQALEEKPERHGRRSHPHSEETALLLSTNHTNDEFYDREADVPDQDQPPVFPSRLGDSEEAPGCASSDSEGEGYELWDIISNLQEHPVEGNSENIHQCQVQLKREKKKLEEKIMHLEITALGKDDKTQQLSEDFETCLHEHQSLATQYEDLRSKLARKEKECYELHCEIDRKADTNQGMDERDTFEFQLSNVKMALKFCGTLILDTKNDRQEYAMMNILKIAKRVKGLERPWTS